MGWELIRINFPSLPSNDFPANADAKVGTEFPSLSKNWVPLKANVPIDVSVTGKSIDLIGHP